MPERIMRKCFCTLSLSRLLFCDVLASWRAGYAKTRKAIIFVQAMIIKVGGKGDGTIALNYHFIAWNRNQWAFSGRNQDRLTVNIRAVWPCGRINSTFRCAHAQNARSTVLPIYAHAALDYIPLPHGRGIAWNSSYSANL